MKTYMNVLPFIRKTSDFWKFETIKLLVFGQGKIKSIFEFVVFGLVHGRTIAMGF